MTPRDPGSLDGSGDQLIVNLVSRNSIINWNSFNIGTGKSVGFNGTQSGNQAVLNRVTGAGASSIDGYLGSSPNVAVYLVNPNGIVFGSGTVNVGALVASTLNITDDDFTDTAGSIDGTDSLTFSATALNSVTAATDAFIVTERSQGLGQLVFLGESINTAAGSVLSAGSDAAFVAARNVTVTRTAGSPLSFTINQGGGGIAANSGLTGVNVTLAVAALTGGSASLTVGDTLHATGVASTDRGIVLVAGRSTSDGSVTVVDNSVNRGASSINASGAMISRTDIEMRSQGNLTASGLLQGRDIAIKADGNVVTGEIRARDDIAIVSVGTTTTGALTGGTFFNGDTAVDAAGAADRLVPTASFAANDVDLKGNGVVVGAVRTNGINSDVRIDGGTTGIGHGDRDLDIRAPGGNMTLRGQARGRDIALQAVFVTVGDLVARDDVVVRPVSGGAFNSSGGITSGVAVSGLGPVDIAGAGDTLRGPPQGGNDVDVTSGQSISLAGGVSAVGSGSDVRLIASLGVFADGAVSGQGGVTIRAGRDAWVGNLTSADGPVSITASFGDIRTRSGDRLDVSAGAAVTVSASGRAFLGSVTGAGNVQITGGTVDATSATSTGSSLAMTATNGALTLGTGSAAGGATLRTTGGGAAGDVTVSTSLTSTGEDGMLIESVSDVRVARVVSTRGAGIDVVAQSGEVTGFNGGRATLLASGSGALISVDAGTRALLGNVVAGVRAQVSADTIDIVTIQGLGKGGSGVSLLEARAGDLTLVNAVSNNSILLTASGAINATGRVLAVDGIEVTGGTAANIASIQSRRGDINVTGDTVNVGTATADMGSLTLAANVGNLTLGTGVAGTTADLRTTAGTGDVIVNTSLTSGGNATVSTVRNARLAKVESLRGDISVTANAGAVTGVGAGGRGNLFANGLGGDVTVNARDLVLLQTAAAENAVSITGGTLDIDIVQARNGTLNLTANVDDLTLGAGAVGGNATLSAVRDVNLLRFLKARGNILLTGGRSVNGEEKATSSGGTVVVVEPVASPIP